MIINSRGHSRLMSVMRRLPLTWPSFSRTTLGDYTGLWLLIPLQQLVVFIGLYGSLSVRSSTALTSQE
eukprot:6038517-Karenia_brevis.AAC.1